MYKLTVENEKGEKLQLNPSRDYIVDDISGLTPADATINSSIVSTNDGAVFNSARINPRQIVLIIKPQGNVEKNRINLYKYFKAKKPVKLYYKNGLRDVVIEGRVESFDGSFFTLTQTLTISIICLDPYFKYVRDSIAGISQVIPLFEFPFAIDEEGIEFSILDKTFTQVVLNEGDVETGVIIELTASNEVVNPRIYNVDTGEMFGLNFTMQLGDLIRINTNRNHKSVELVRYGETRDIINNIMKNPAWFTLEVGDNIFSYDCDDGHEFLQLKFIYQNKYEGV